MAHPMLLLVPATGKAPSTWPRLFCQMPFSTEHLVETVGKRLSKARLERGLTIDETAHETKMRPDKILALENDDYSRFGNNAYAKGFLLIYGRFLRVDVSEQVRALETHNVIRATEYQYLKNAPAPQIERAARRGRGRQTRKPSLAPLIGFFFLVVVCGLGFYLYVTAQRLGSLDKAANKSSKETARPSAQEVAAPTMTPPVAPPELTPAPRSPADATAVPSPNSIIPAVPVTSPSGTLAGPGSLNGLEVRRAEPVTPIRVPGASALASSPAAGVINEVVIEAVKKTWVKICRDDPNSPPIFMDYIYPNAGPLKLRGARIFIEAQDPAAVQIHKNGAPMAYQAPGIIIQ
jgi:cytoskeletal protein RodZ